MQTFNEAHANVSTVLQMMKKFAENYSMNPNKASHCNNGDKGNVNKQPPVNNSK